MFNIETANWEKKYPLSAQKVNKIANKECRHWSKHWQPFTATKGEQSIELVGCKCGHVLTTIEMERIKKEEVKYYRK